MIVAASGQAGVVTGIWPGSPSRHWGIELTEGQPDTSANKANEKKSRTMKKLLAAAGLGAAVTLGSLAGAGTASAEPTSSGRHPRLRPINVYGDNWLLDERYGLPEPRRGANARLRRERAVAANRAMPAYDPGGRARDQRLRWHLRPTVRRLGQQRRVDAP